jgi:LacI family transcriptional regulator
MEKRRPNIFDVARATGTSKSTVSRALRNSPLIAVDTKKRVQAVARKIGYRPSMVFSVMGSRNRRGQPNSSILPLAYLYDDPCNKDMNTVTDFQYLPSAAEQYGYYIDPYNLGKFKSARELEKMLFYRGYSGVVIGRIANDKSLVHELDLSGFTIVSNTNTFRNYKYHRVSGDVVRTVQIVWDKAVAAGYRRIAVATCRHSPPLPDDDIRLAAVLQRQRRDLKLLKLVPPFEGDPNDMAAFRGWIKQWRPDAVIGFHIGQYYELTDVMKFKVPADIGFASIMTYPESPWSKFISGIKCQEQEVAEVCISIIDQEIRKGIQGIPEHILTVLIEPQWLNGRTL